MLSNLIAGLVALASSQLTPPTLVEGEVWAPRREEEPLDPSRAIFTFALGSGWSMTDFGASTSRRSQVDLGAAVHARLGFRKGWLDAGLTGEAGAFLFGETGLLGAVDLGLTGELGRRAQGSFRLIAGWHRLLNVGGGLSRSGSPIPVELPALGAELELRIRNFTEPGRRPWFGFSIYTLADLPSWSSDPVGGPLRPPEPKTLHVGGVSSGVRFRVGFDLN